MDRHDRVMVWLAAGMLALSAALMFALPILADFQWLRLDWERRVRVLCATGGVLCGLAIWRLQVSLGWSRRTWRGRALLLLLGPGYLLPVWLALRDRPIDPEQPLTSLQLPGFRVALPDWALDVDRDHWSGKVTVRRRVTNEEVSVEWHPGDPLSAEEEATIAQNMGLEKTGEEPATVAGSTVRTSFFERKGWQMGRTSWSCGDGRRITMMSRLADGEVLRRLQARMLTWVSCTPEKPPALVYPRVALPAEFKETERSEGGLAYRTDDELIFISAAISVRKLESWKSAGGAHLAGEVARGLGFRTDGTAEKTPAGMAVDAVAANGTRSRITLGYWSCSDVGFWAAHQGPSDGKQLAAQRFAQITCPAR